MKSSTRSAVIALLMSTALKPHAAMAQEKLAGDTLQISRATGSIKVDGDLSEEGWKAAKPVTTWYEVNPGDNTEPALRNVGRLAYDDHFFYASFEFEDPNPKAIRAPYSDRDDSGGGFYDFGGIVLDAGNSGRTGKLFVVTPRNIQNDTIIDDSSGEDPSPDFFWESATRITEHGWVLESGLGETSAYWAWIAPTVAQDTRVCVYDRAGWGRSDEAASPQDGVGVATDLHTLLAHVPGPFVLVGHSSGAQYVRIFAGRYPSEVAGMVLLDPQPAEALTRLPAFPGFYRVFRRVSATFPPLARLGVARLVALAGSDGLPPQARNTRRVYSSSARTARSLRDEFAQLPTALEQAHSFRTLGELPLILVTAVRDAPAGWLPLQDEMAALSTNSFHEVVANATHSSLIEDEHDAGVSSQAIRLVVESVRSARLLARP